MADNRDLFDDKVVAAHSDSLRQLVRALVDDESAVDDVLQETWLVALASPPKPGFAAAAWLRGIARNVARRLRRTNSRRIARETAAARADMAPAASEVVSRLEHLYEVLDIVYALAEPIRTAVVMRYLDGHMPREIAARLNVPVDTVKTRLHGGLRLMREAMDARHGGDRSAWHVALAPFVFNLPHAAAVTAASSSSLASVMTGGAALKSALGVVVGLILACLWMRLAGGTDPAVLPPVSVGVADAAASHPATGDSPARAPVFLVPFHDADQLPSAATRASLIGVRILVLDKHTGAPVPAARVRIWDTSGPRVPGADERALLRYDALIEPADAPSVEATSDASGTVTFANCPARAWLTADRGDRFGAGRLDQGGGTESVIAIERDTRLRVRVVDAAGAAVGGVPVRLSRLSTMLPAIDVAYGTTSLRDGVFEAPHLQNGQGLFDSDQTKSTCARLGATFDDEQEVAFDLPRQSGAALVLRLPPSARLAVDVVDPDNRPFAEPALVGVMVKQPATTQGAPRPVEAFADDWRSRTCWLALEHGQCVFPFVAVGATFTVKVLALDQEHALATMDVAGPVRPGEERRVTVEVGARRSIVSARLLDDTQNPIRDRAVLLSPSFPPHVILARTEALRSRSDHAGIIRIPLCDESWLTPGGRLRIDTRDPDSVEDRAVAYVAIAEPPASASAPSRDVALGDVVMHPTPLLVAGIVCDAAGAPIAGVAVRAEFRRTGDSRGFWDMPHSFQTRSRADGGFAIRDFCDDGELRLAVDATGHLPEPAIPFTRGAEQVVVTLTRAGALRGSLVLPAAVATREVRVCVTGDCVPTGVYRSRRPFADVQPDGTFTITGLRAGTGSIVVVTKGEDMQGTRGILARIDDIEITAGGTTRDPRLQSLDLSKRIRVRTVSVRDALKAPIDGATVTFHSEPIPHVTADPSRQTTRDGRANLVTGPEPVIVSVTKQGWLTQTMTMIDDDLQVELEQGVTLEVVIITDVPFPPAPHNIGVSLQRADVRQTALSTAPTADDWDYNRAWLADATNRVATFQVAATGTWRLAACANLEGRTCAIATREIDVPRSPAHQRIEWHLSADDLQRALAPPR